MRKKNISLIFFSIFRAIDQAFAKNFSLILVLLCFASKRGKENFKGSNNGHFNKGSKICHL